jgi:CBS domain-containing protein
MSASREPAAQATAPAPGQPPGQPSGRRASDPAPLGDRTVGDLMWTTPVTIGPDAHVASAAYLMKRTPCSALVVLSEEEPPKPVGLLADGDISQAVADGLDLDDARIHQLHLRRPEPVDPATPVTALAERMLAETIDHLPVVQGGRLVGMVDLAAVCRALLDDARRTGSAAGGAD